MKIPTLAVPAALKGLDRVIGENAPTILTIAGMVGTVTSTVLAARAGEKANQTLTLEAEKRNIHREVNTPAITVDDIRGKERAALVWKLYMPAAGVATLSCVSIFGAQHINAKRLATLGAAYAITENRFEEYKDKVKEQLGLTKEEKLNASLAEDEVKRSQSAGAQVFTTGNGDHHCYDRYTARHFKSTRQSLEQSINEVNATLLRRGDISLNDVYSNFGLDQPSHGDSMGWRAENGLIELEFSTTVNNDGEPVLAYDFRPAPRPGYDLAH